MLKNKNNHTIHQRIERLAHHRLCLALILGCLGMAVIRADTKMFTHLRQAYAEGFGMVGMYMREETARMPVSFGNNARVITISSQ